jgi:fumarate hydratase class II
VAAGEFDARFPLSVWQTGSGTHTNMNVNEVIAGLASLALGAGLGAARRVHPNDEVNLGQSSNDVFPTAMHIAAVLQVRPLRAALAWLRAALHAKATAFADLVKIGRTHLREAALLAALPEVHALAIGGTAVGTGLNTHRDLGLLVAARLAERPQAPLVAHNRFAAMAGHEALVAPHGALRLLAVALTKIANDIRLLGSGPRAGLGELRLPANEPGSSIMPGKVNPSQVEALTMVCAQVLGHDVAIGIAVSQGQLQLNAYKPLIAHTLLDSQRLLADAMASFAAHCVKGIEADAARAAELLGRSLMLRRAAHAWADLRPLQRARASAGGLAGRWCSMRSSGPRGGPDSTMQQD